LEDHVQDAPDLFIDLAGINPEVTFAAGGAEEVIAQIEEDARGEASTDLATATARGAIAALAYRVARTKTALDDMGKDHVADLKKRAKEVDIERKAIRDRLDALRDTLRKPLTDWENAENSRIEEHQSALGDIEATAVFDVPEPSAADIADRIDRLSRIGGNRDWQEFQKRAEAARQAATEKLVRMLEAAKRREAERAELETLRKQAELTKVVAPAVAQARLEAAGAVAEANQRADNAVTIARQQVEAEQAETAGAAAARAADRGHRAKINGAVRDALCAKAGLSPDLATAVVVAIARGQIDHASINY
jgi:colicin import membrane protein